MSKKQNNILIQPPMFLDENGSRESLVSEGHRCPACGGNGFHWSDDQVGGQVKVPCRVCKGAKQLTARITIEWVPCS